MANNPYFLTWEEVLDQMISTLPPQWRPVTGKVLTRLLTAIALAIEALYALLARVLRLSILATSEGDWLRSLVASWGMRPFGGTQATVVVRFSRFTAATEVIRIPQGTKVGAVYGQQFIVPSDHDLLAGNLAIDIACQALRPGVSGNIAPGDIISVVTPLTGIDRVSNPNAGAGGSDGETDEQIKARVPLYLESLHRATVPATEYAVGEDKATFPGVRSFLTQRNYGVPGYFRGILSDASGGNQFRARNWQFLENGIWFVPTNLTRVDGLVSAGWPCRRFGIVGRSPDGEEVWSGSRFVADMANGTWRFCHDRPAGRLYAKADGRDLNTLQCTIVAGVIRQAQRELELRWAANGVFLDVLVPFLKTGAIALTYRLEPGYSQTDVEQNIRQSTADFIEELRMGQAFDIEGLYARLNRISGAAGIVVTEPTSNVIVQPDEIFRLQGGVTIRRLAS